MKKATRPMKGKSQQRQLAIVMVAVADLNPAPYNPRKWDQAAVVNLKTSIRRFGFVDPLIVNGATNRKNVIIGGHFRYSIAKELGMAKVPVVYVDIPSIEKEKELNLRLNRNTGEWDFEKLKDFDMGLLLKAGFDDTDLSAIWDGMLQTEDDDFDVEKELEKIKKPKTKPGDLFVLGNHRLGSLEILMPVWGGQKCP
jgi:ParB-like chromosome segregation protein Spo0J